MASNGGIVEAPEEVTHLFRRILKEMLSILGSATALEREVERAIAGFVDEEVARSERAQAAVAKELETNYAAVARRRRGVKKLGDLPGLHRLLVDQILSLSPGVFPSKELVGETLRKGRKGAAIVDTIRRLTNKGLSRKEHLSRTDVIEDAYASARLFARKAPIEEENNIPVFKDPDLEHYLWRQREYFARLLHLAVGIIEEAPAEFRASDARPSRTKAGRLWEGELDVPMDLKETDVRDAVREAFQRAFLDPYRANVLWGKLGAANPRHRLKRLTEGNTRPVQLYLGVCQKAESAPRYGRGHASDREHEQARRQAKRATVMAHEKRGRKHKSPSNRADENGGRPAADRLR